MHKIICDENIPYWFVKTLREKGRDVLYISETHKSINDISICNLLNQYGGVLLTRDKDFGDLVFWLGTKMERGSIILIRGDVADLHASIIKYIKKTQLDKRQFIVISKDKIRIRKI